MKKKTALKLFLAILGLLLLVLCLVVTLTGGTYLLLPHFLPQASLPQSTTIASSQELTITPGTASDTPGLPVKNPAGAQTDLVTLENTQVNVNNPITMAERLLGLSDIPRTVPTPSAFPQQGDVQQFWVSNQDTNQFFQVTATLRYVGSHLYFWIENGVSYDPAAVKKLVDAFDKQIYTTDRTFFGSEWTPGIDGDPRLYALYARNLGRVVAGYYSPMDEYPPEVFQYSNAHEMFDINADTVSLSGSAIYSVMAHEFQHMIHWNQDRSEDLWLNEGFSVLAQFINGYSLGGYDTSYIANTDTQLDDWSLDEGANAPHYGASFLYLDYLLSRYGSKVTQAVDSSPLHGLDSIDAVLSALQIKDPLTGQMETADDLFADWAIANFLQDPQVDDGRYAYQNYKQAPQAHTDLTENKCPLTSQNEQVHQYGVVYIDITCAGQYTLKFIGAATVPLVSAQPYSGSYDFWSNKGDQADMTLTRSFDFTNVNGPIELTFHTWYDLEENYDFVYLEVSTDGQHWKILTTPGCSTNNTSGSNYGCGYTGSTSGWISQTVDLSAFKGQKVEIRFEYLTDGALNGEGFLLDDVSIPQVNYSTGFENGNGGWQADGFARVQGDLPQTFKVSLISEGRTISVQHITLDASQSAEISLDLGGDVTHAILVVSGTTRFTRQEASYQISISP